MDWEPSTSFLKRARAATDEAGRLLHARVAYRNRDALPALRRLLERRRNPPPSSPHPWWMRQVVSHGNRWTRTPDNVLDAWGRAGVHSVPSYEGWRKEQPAPDKLPSSRTLHNFARPRKSPGESTVQALDRLCTERERKRNRKKK